MVHQPPHPATLTRPTPQTTMAIIQVLFSIYLYFTWFLKLFDHPNYLLSHFIIHYSTALPPSILCWLLQFREFFGSLWVKGRLHAASSLLVPSRPREFIVARSVDFPIFNSLSFFSFLLCFRIVSSRFLHRLHLFPLQIWVEVFRSPARRIATNCV